MPPSPSVCRRMVLMSTSSFKEKILYIILPLHYRGSVYLLVQCGTKNKTAFSSINFLTDDENNNYAIHSNNIIRTLCFTMMIVNNEFIFIINTHHLSKHCS